MRDILRTAGALLLMVLFGLALTGAQDKGDQGSNMEPPKDGKGVIFKGTSEDVALHDVIRMYVEDSGQTVLYDPKKLAGNVTVVAPKAGAEMTTEDLVQSALKQFRLTMLSDGNVQEIIPAAEAITQCETVDREQLKSLPPGRFVRVLVQLKACEANAVRGALQNLTTRQGGVVNPIAGSNSLILCDYVSNMEDMLKLIDDMEASTEVVSRVFTLKHVVYSDIKEAILSSVMFGQVRRPGSPGETTVGATASGKSIVVTGVVYDIDRIAGVIEQLDVEQGD
ncbi:MAG: hypothetical protein H6839_08100 [Planctomycetes bacterium]|nr:hypothetical protein [Planctomycetota bacterium]